MAKVRFGLGVVGVAGEVAGAFFGRNRFGAWLGRKPVCGRLGGRRRAETKALFDRLGKAWSYDLTDDERRQWKCHAQNYPVQGWGGDPQTLDGRAMFLKVNSARIAAEGTLTTEPPGAYGALSPQSVRLEVSRGDEVVVVYFEPDPPPDDHVVRLWCTQSLPAGVEGFERKLKRVVPGFQLEGSGSDVSLEYLEIFGQIGHVGQRIGARLEFVNEVGGGVSPPLQGLFLIGA